MGGRGVEEKGREEVQQTKGFKEEGKYGLARVKCREGQGRAGQL